MFWGLRCLFLVSVLGKALEKIRFVELDAGQALNMETDHVHIRPQQQNIKGRQKIKKKMKTIQYTVMSNQSKSFTCFCR